MASFDYDLVVIGSGPAGQRVAIQAAKLGKKAALVERRAVFGGVCINTGTIPSKTLREALLYLTGYRLRGTYAAGDRDHSTVQRVKQPFCYSRWSPLRFGLQRANPDPGSSSQRECR
jgi:pyruvate/2-oxoglutarate dehydrogenase complex dihydrolipoamide dehydrogenase (E3) component